MCRSERCPPRDSRVRRFSVIGEAIRAGDGSMRAVWTPGHSQDHCCFADDSAREIYCGDLIRAGGTIVIAASRGGDLRAYLHSLERVRSLAPRRLFPGHGPAIEDPAAAIDSYVRHRAERDAQVLEALRSGLDTPASFASRIYVGSIRRSNEQLSTPSWRIWSSWSPKGEWRNGARSGSRSSPLVS